VLLQAFAAHSTFLFGRRPSEIKLKLPRFCSLGHAAQFGRRQHGADPSRLGAESQTFRVVTKCYNWLIGLLLRWST
jgi:hypothetical protein